MKVRGNAAIFTGSTSEGTARELTGAFAKVREDLELASAQNDIFTAHLEMLDDPVLSESIAEAKGRGCSDAEAVTEAESTVCEMFASIDDEYIRARADDVRDLCNRLRRALRGEDGRTEEFPEGSIIVAEELLPSDLLSLKLSSIRGIICRKGSNTGHVCIIARAHGIPFQMGVDVSGIRDGELVEVDDPLVGADIAAKVRMAGRKVFANAGSVEQVREAMAAGADGIGLFRTEFLFIGTERMPSLEEQTAIYKDAVLACDGRPIVFRTLDAGGDKDIPWLGLPKEDNPFLGLRGIRLCKSHPEVLRTQIQAIADAATAVPGSDVRIMFPMVDTAEELRLARRMLPYPLKCGFMVETPASILNIAELAEGCSFASIGSNDLTQYIMAADRCSETVSYLYDAFCPTMRKALSFVVESAHKAGLEVCLCGELASDPSATDFLLELGLDCFSINHLY